MSYTTEVFSGKDKPAIDGEVAPGNVEVAVNHDFVLLKLSGQIVVIDRATGLRLRDFLTARLGN